MSKTELMDIGEHCSLCGQIDFLPFKCSCKATFCSQHRSPEVHNCPNIDTSLNKRLAAERASVSTSHLPPSSSLFPDRKNFKVELKTTENNPVTIKSQLEKTNKKSALTKLIKFFNSKSKTKTSKKPVSNATTRIIEVSKLKNKAKGDTKIGATERIYIWVQVIDDESTFDRVEKNAIYISRAWPLGRSLDSIATILKLKNVNNRTNDAAEKLFLFKQEIGKENDSNFIKVNTSDRSSTLKDGDTLFLVRGTEI